MHQLQQAFQFKEKCEAADLKLRYYTLNKADPFSCIKTEKDEADQLFHPETVLVTDFGTYDRFVEEPSVSSVDERVTLKPEKKPRKRSDVGKPAKRIKVEQSSVDIDEKQLVEEAQIVDGRYQCKFCGKSLADRQTFRLHIRLHTGTNLKRCTICERGFAKKNHLERHLAIHDNTHKCSFCPSAFLTAAEQTEHEMSCKKSNRGDATKVKNEEGDATHKAPMEVTITTQTQNNENEAEADDESEPEDFANETGEEAAKEEQKDTKIGVIRSRWRIPLDDDEQRLMKSANIVDDRYECPMCPKTLARKELLLLHIRTHTGKNCLRCSVCDRVFAKPYNLNRHMLMHDNVINPVMDDVIAKAVQPDGSFQCPMCTKVFVERSSFRLHLRTHAGNVPRHCVICNKSFAEEGEFLQHNIVEHGNVEGSLMKPMKMEGNGSGVGVGSVGDDDEDERLVNSAEMVNGRFNCTFCDKTLANRSTLKHHIRLHLKKKLKMCEFCGHGFAKNSHLERHVKTHFPKRPECKFCHATFDSVEEQKEHTAAVHKDELFAQKVKTAIVPWTQPNGRKVCQCMICDSVFDKISTLRSHLDWHADSVDWFNGVDLKSNAKFVQMFDELKGHDELTNEYIARVLQTKLKEDSPDEVSKMYRISNERNCELSLTDSETETETNDNDDDGHVEKKRIYVCNECPVPSSYDRLHKLMSHFKIDHQAVSKQLQCSHCQQHFPNHMVLAKHLRQQCENDSKPFHCTMCFSRFTWENSLASHCAAYHANESKMLGASRRPFKCNLCTKSFYTEQRLNEHRLRHLPAEKRFACDVCDKRFSRYDHLG